jgi:hypothetical protein
MTETRICKKCGETKPFEAFPKANKTKTGKILRRCVCGPCYYLHNTFQQALKTRAWYENYKKTCKCKECGLTDHRVLDFHHRDPKEKLFEVSKKASGGYSPKTILKEIKKCDVLCANCHRILTYEKRRKGR